MKCLHKIVGLPKNSKRIWREVVVKDINGKITDYTCSCKEGKKVIIDRSVLSDTEWEKYFCKFCGKKLVPRKERRYFVVCPWCKEKMPI